MANLGLLGKKAKVFLGASGSVVLGYVIAWTLIALSQSTPRHISPGLVLWCVALPVMDTLAVIYRRLKRGVSPFTPDRTHIHHLLMNAGLGPRRTLVYLVGFSIVLPFVGVVIHAELGAVANLVAFVVVATVYGAFTAHLEREQAALIRSPDAMVRRVPGKALARPGIHFQPKHHGQPFRGRRD
jgi:UDP-GlcNAc:undecaprenyl-phosphate GlcNAc-1-phosphate transferase